MNIAVVADDAGQIARLGAAAQAAGTTIGLVVDIDLGTHRTGVPPEQVEDLARLASQTPGLRYRGIQAYLATCSTADLEARRGACQGQPASGWARWSASWPRRA